MKRPGTAGTTRSASPDNAPRCRGARGAGGRAPLDMLFDDAAGTLWIGGDGGLARHRKKVEMLFAHLKRILRLDRLRLRGLSGPRDEFLLRLRGI